MDTAPSRCTRVQAIIESNKSHIKLVEFGYRGVNGSVLEEYRFPPTKDLTETVFCLFPRCAFPTFCLLWSSWFRHLTWNRFHQLKDSHQNDTVYTGIGNDERRNDLTRTIICHELMKNGYMDYMFAFLATGMGYESVSQLQAASCILAPVCYGITWANTH